MFVRVNAIFNTCGAILHEGRIGGLLYHTLSSEIFKKLRPLKLH